MTDQEFIQYMESKAVQSNAIDHDPLNGKKAFYVIDDPYDLSEIDNALRNFASFPAMILEVAGGMLNDNGSSNYTDTIESSFMIVSKRSGDESIRNVRSACLGIAKQVLYQMRKDCNSKSILPGKFIQFRIEDVPYVPVGPMLLQYYGYMVSFQFICPFNF